MTTYTDLKADAVAARTRYDKGMEGIDAAQDINTALGAFEVAWEALRDWDCCTAKLEEMEQGKNMVRIE